MPSQAQAQPFDDRGTLGGNWDRPSCSAGPDALKGLRDHVNARLDQLVTAGEGEPESLNRAMRQALLAPGKRVRPLLVMLTVGEFGLDPGLGLDAGCAIELIHTASLILDDLPCMDDAKTRRGEPATHVAFGEATAVLASIAMLSRAFGVLAEMDRVALPVRLELVRILARAAGAEGLAAGQERDLKERAPLDPMTKIDAINDLKTGALFIAALEIGGLIAGATPPQLSALTAAGREVGLAFQTLDDVIDVKRSTAQAGKDTGKDLGKGTIAAVEGIEAARAEVARHAIRAQAAIEPFAKPGGPLRGFVAALLEQAADSAAQASGSACGIGG